MQGTTLEAALQPKLDEVLWRLDVRGLAVIYCFTPQNRRRLQPFRSAVCALARKSGGRWRVVRYVGRLSLSEWHGWEQKMRAIRLPILAVDLVPKLEGQPAKLRRCAQ